MDCFSTICRFALEGFFGCLSIWEVMAIKKKWGAFLKELNLPPTGSNEPDFLFNFMVPVLVAFPVKANIQRPLGEEFKFHVSLAKLL